MQICTIYAYQLSLFVGLLTVTDPDLELARGEGRGEGGLFCLPWWLFILLQCIIPENIHSSPSGNSN